MNLTLSLLSQAYRFAFPLVLMDATRRSAAGVNVLVHSRGLADADEKFVVTPNVDTVYSQLWLDLSRGPVVLTLPETDRYFTAQVMDAWTNTVCSLREAGDYVFARADQAGQAPDGMPVVEMPTAMGWLLIRVLHVFCQARIPKITVKIPCFHNGKFPAISGMWQQEPAHA